MSPASASEICVPQKTAELKPSEQTAPKEQNYLSTLEAWWEASPKTEDYRSAYNTARDCYYSQSSTFVCRDWKIDSWPDLPGHVTKVHLKGSFYLVKLLASLPNHINKAKLEYLKFTGTLALADSINHLKLVTCDFEALSIKNPEKIKELYIDNCYKFTTFADKFTSASNLTVTACYAIVCIPINTKFPALEFLSESFNIALLSFTEYPCTEHSWCAAHVNALKHPSSLKDININSATVQDWSILFDADGNFIDPENHGIQKLQYIANKYDPTSVGALLKLSELTEQGLLINKNSLDAKVYLYWVEGSSDKSNPVASLSLGELYLRDNCLVEKNSEQATYYLTKAIQDAEAKPLFLFPLMNSIIQRAQALLNFICWSAAISQIASQSTLLLGNFGQHGINSEG